MKAGRPRRVPTRQEHATIVDALRVGNFFETACALAGVTIATGRHWLERGAEQGSETEAFARDVRSAIAESENEGVTALQVLVRMNDLKAVTWYLERRHPTRWGARVKQAVRDELDSAIDRIEGLEAELGQAVVARVLAAIAGVESAAGVETAGSDEFTH